MRQHVSLTGCDLDLGANNYSYRRILGSGREFDTKLSVNFGGNISQLDYRCASIRLLSALAMVAIGFFICNL